MVLLGIVVRPWYEDCVKDGQGLLLDSVCLVVIQKPQVIKSLQKQICKT